MTSSASAGGDLSRIAPAGVTSVIRGQDRPRTERRFPQDDHLGDEYASAHGRRHLLRENGLARGHVVGNRERVDFDLDSYIDVHLAYELKYMLVSATTWRAVHREEDRGPHAPHLVVMAMESTFLHVRVLYEFLHLEEGWKSRSPHSAASSALWSQYARPLHEKALHPSPRRPYAPNQMMGDDLKDRVVDLTLDVLRLWDEVSNQQQMEAHREQMIRARTRAVADADESARWLRIDPVFR